MSQGWYQLYIYFFCNLNFFLPLSHIYQVVLAAASPVFEAMVENEHKEGIEGRADIDLDHKVDVDLGLGGH